MTHSATFQIPELEVDLLTITVARALHLTRAGHHVAGYWELVNGHERSRLYVGEAWGPELLTRGQHALRAYV